MHKPFLIRFSREDEVLRARVIGVRTLESTIGYWEELLARMAERRPSGLLLVDELRGEELSASEWKTLVAKLLGRGMEGIRIAHVKRFSLDQIDYCERAARAAGLQARVFRNEDEARRWLGVAG